MKESLFYQEIMQEGAINTARAYIIDLLKARFGGKGMSAIAQAVNALEDTEELSRLHRLAGTCKQLDDFRAAVLGPKAGR